MTASPLNPEDRPSLMRDLRSGNADWVARILVSLLAAAGLAAIAVFALAVVDQSFAVARSTQGPGGTLTYYRGRIDDKHNAMVLMLAGAAWCVSLVYIWRGFGRFTNGLRTIFGIVAVWVTAIPICVIIDSTMRSSSEDLWIGAVILTAIAATLCLLTMAAHRFRAGRSVINAAGHVNVHCPSCGYSLVGLSESRCPECGASYTLDELIRSQRYAGDSEANAPAPPSTPFIRKVSS